MDDDDFLAAIEEDNKAGQVAPEPEVETPKEPDPEPQPEPEQAPEPEPPEPQVAAAPEPKPDAQQFVPLGAVLDERDKRKALEAQLAQYRAQEQPQQLPDVFEDPDGFAAAQDQKVQQALYASNLRWSERMATIEHGKDTVVQARDWGFKRCDADPYFNAKVASSDDPIGFVVSEWQREQIASQVSPEDFKQFQAWRQAQAELQPPPSPGTAAPQALPRSIPPRSLASAPSAGGIRTEVEPDEEDIFKGAFKR